MIACKKQEVESSDWSQIPVAPHVYDPSAIPSEPSEAGYDTFWPSFWQARELPEKLACDMAETAGLQSFDGGHGYAWGMRRQSQALRCSSVACPATPRTKLLLRRSKRLARFCL